MLTIALLANLSALCDADWLNMAAKKGDQEAVAWVKQQRLEDQESVKGKHIETDWLDVAAKRADQEDVAWVKQQLLEDKELVKRKHLEMDVIPSTHKKCLTAITQHDADGMDVPIYVMISFSVPDQTWISLSAEMEKIGAVFVLRGLPNNSFKELSKRLQRLSKLGVRAEVRLDPMLYTTYKIEKSPTFLIVDKDKDTYHTLSGNVSLAYAMEKMGEQ